MNMNTNYNIKVSCTYMLFRQNIIEFTNLKETYTRYEEIIILELRFGTKLKNRKLRLISQTSGIESNHSGYRS